MCLDGGAFLFLQDSTQWRLSLQTEQIQVLRHRHLPDRHDAAPFLVAHVQIQKRLHQFSVEEAEGMAIGAWRRCPVPNTPLRSFVSGYTA